MLLALGLNVVVGWGGLLDLGYVAFYGIGAYTYALLSSHQLGVHLPTPVTIPIVVVVGAVAGFLVGLPSRRLIGDYLAIVTLFFLQIFLTVATNGDQIAGHNITGGANGILNVDPLHLLGHSLEVQHEGVFAVGYLYIAIALFGVVYAALHFVNHSRTGRAWRSLREDPLAAEAMGMPVNLLKLMAFSFGAAIAALTGTLFASLNASAFPLSFSFPLVITVYTMVILGGQGNLAGVTIGAVLISVLLELLRDAGDARILFYLVGLLVLAYAFGRSRKLVVMLAAIVAFGFADARHRRPHTPQLDERACGRGPRQRALALGDHPDEPQHLDRPGLVHHPDLPDPRAHAGARLGARHPARADRLPRHVRVGERPARPARRDALHRARRAPDRAHDRAPERPARRAAHGDHLMAATLLELRGVSLAFGGLKVVSGLDLTVAEGEIVSVIGPNGAGKTTLFNLITGIYEPDDGDILLEGRSITGLEPHQINRLGIARTFQTLRLFLNMSVRENVMAAAYGRTKAGVVRSMLRTPGMRREEQEIRRLAEENLSFFGERLKGYRWDQPAYSLSYANRRRLEIARAMATGPKLLLLDEPAAGMNPVETHEITELIARLRTEAGFTILVIEHDMHVVEGISDRVVALDHGVKIVEGTFEQVATDPRVVEAYLGTKAAATK